MARKGNKMRNQLYGDGIHDDAPAIQELLDERKAEVVLPAPKKHYSLGSTLKIHGGQCLKTSPFTVFRLLPYVDACMVEDDDFCTDKENICIDGGIWDMNNQEQSPNPAHFPGKDGLTLYDKLSMRGMSLDTLTELPDIYFGICMRFCRVKNLTVKNVTYRNPVLYGVQIARVEDFTFRDITFDYQVGAPKLWNMDGIHIEGYCKNGYISNLKGPCHDDMVALTADDGMYGPIENVVVDGVFAEHSKSAVRLLSHGIPVKNVHIRNIYGSFYSFCIAFTKYHGPAEERGYMKNVTVEHVCAKACEGTADVPGGTKPFIWVEKGLDMEDLFISNVSREEHTYPTPMIKIDEGATVTNMVLSNIKQVSHLGMPIEQLANGGKIQNLITNNLINL